MSRAKEKKICLRKSTGLSRVKIKKIKKQVRYLFKEEKGLDDEYCD